MPGESKTSPRRLAAITKQVKALDLRLAGATFDQIGAALGYTRPGAYLAVKAALKRVQAPNVVEYRRVNIERLNRLRLAIWRQATGGDFKAIQAELSIQEREARYLGLDAPTRQELTGQGGGPIEVEAVFEDLERKLRSIAERTRARGVPEKPDA